MVVCLDPPPALTGYVAATTAQGVGPSHRSDYHISNSHHLTLIVNSVITTNMCPYISILLSCYILRDPKNIELLANFALYQNSWFLWFTLTDTIPIYTYIGYWLAASSSVSVCKQPCHKGAIRFTLQKYLPI